MYPSELQTLIVSETRETCFNSGSAFFTFFFNFFRFPIHLILPIMKINLISITFGSLKQLSCQCHTKMNDCRTSRGMSL